MTLTGLGLALAAVATLGAAVPLGVTNWKWSDTDVAELMAFGPIKVTSTVPAPCVGVMAVIWVGELTMNDVAATPPKETEVTPVKLLPLTVTVWPPVVKPMNGATPLMVGAAGVV